MRLDYFKEDKLLKIRKQNIQLSNKSDFLSTNLIMSNEPRRKIILSFNFHFIGSYCGLPKYYYIVAIHYAINLVSW